MRVIRYGLPSGSNPFTQGFAPADTLAMVQNDWYADCAMAACRGVMGGP